MTQAKPRSLIGRFFGAIWGLFVFAYRAIVVLSVVLSLVLLWSAFHGGKAMHIENNVPLTLIPNGALVEQSENTGRSFLRQLGQDKPTQTVMRDLVEALDTAAHDSRVPFAVVKLDDLESAGLAQLQDVGAAMQRFRAAGKPIYAFGESFDQNQYYLAAQADEVSLDPEGLLLLEGYSAYTNFFKDALDKLGVQVNVFRVGQFKSAVEPFLRNDMSPEAKLANQAWLGDLWNVYGQGVATARRLPANAAVTYVDGFADALAKARGDGAALALESKFVTRVETQAEFRKRLGEKVGFDKDKGSFRQIDYGTYLRATRHESPKKNPHKLALVVVQGEIVDGDSDETHAGGDTISQLLDEARRDDDVDAVLLRVNSPGGSVFASEKIRRAVKAIRADGKHVFASMSSVAASGGYWISMDAEQIWAEPSTITGSIGIFGLVPTVDEPLAKLGIHTDGVGTTKLAGTFRIDRPLTPEFRTIMQAQIEKGYREFTGNVATSRKLPLEKVESIAQGRVWSGEAAKGLGLVDQLGTFKDASDALAKVAGYAATDYLLDEMEPPRDWFSQFFGRYFGDLGGDARMDSALGRDVIRSLLPKGALRDEAEALGETFNRLNDPRGEYAYCFCDARGSGRLLR